MELRIFSNSCCTANLDKDLREKMEAKVLAEFPNYTTKASAIEYLLKQAVDAQSSGESNAAEVNELNAKIEAYQVQEEYLKAEIEKLKNAPAKIVEKTVNVEVPQKVFDAEFYQYLKQVAFLVDESFCKKNDVNALVRRVFDHYRRQGNFIFTADDEAILRQNGLM